MMEQASHPCGRRWRRLTATATCLLVCSIHHGPCSEIEEMKRCTPNRGALRAVVWESASNNILFLPMFIAFRLLQQVVILDASNTPASYTTRNEETNRILWSAGRTSPFILYPRHDRAGRQRCTVCSLRTKNMIGVRREYWGGYKDGTNRCCLITPFEASAQTPSQAINHIQEQYASPACCPCSCWSPGILKPAIVSKNHTTKSQWIFCARSALRSIRKIHSNAQGPIPEGQSETSPHLP